jgi:hypothetical protein
VFTTPSDHCFHHLFESWAACQPFQSRSSNTHQAAHSPSQTAISQLTNTQEHVPKSPRRPLFYVFSPTSSRAIPRA